MKPQTAITLWIIGLLLLAACAPSVAEQPTEEATATATAAPIATARPAATPTLGTAFPTPVVNITLAGYIPHYPYKKGAQALLVVAYRAQNYPNGGHYSVTVPLDEPYYTIEAPAGDYYIISYLLGENGKFLGPAGGYTDAVICGLTQGCTNHNLVLVTVMQGGLRWDIKPMDFELKAKSFPLPPAD